MFSVFLGSLMLAYCIYLSIIKPKSLSLDFLNLNFIIIFFFSLSLIFHKNIIKFLNAADDAILGTSGILIQFPLYFGILGILQNSGMIEIFSEMLISASGTIP